MNKSKIAWYKLPISREELAALNQRSDWQRLLQAHDHLGLLVVTGAAAWYAVGWLPLTLLLLILFVHGTFFAHLINALQELVRQTVFKTKALIALFLQLSSFQSWSKPVMFWASHQQRDKYTLHPPADLEFALPQKLTLESFLKSTVVKPWDLWFRLMLVTRLCFGQVDGRWEETLFPPSAVAERCGLFNWSRIILLGHILIVVVSLYFGWWIVPVVVTLAPFYGGLLRYFCNNTLDVGLQDNVTDFRLCTGTFLVNPCVRFQCHSLQWQGVPRTLSHAQAG